MSQQQQPKARQPRRRKAEISPELSEVLNMLKSLEAEFEGDQPVER